MSRNPTNRNAAPSGREEGAPLRGRRCKRCIPLFHSGKMSIFACVPGEPVRRAVPAGRLSDPKMQLFYVPGFVPPRATLPEEESRHCVRVLRLAKGDELHITDGKGNLYACHIADDDPRRCSVEVTSATSGYGRLPYRLTMAVAPTKNSDRFEWFVEKATEVGVERIVPLLCARSERRTFHIARTEKVAAAAMKQSLKAYLPIIDPLTPFGELLATPFGGRRLIAHCDAERTPAGKSYLPSVLRAGEDALVLIGPEGDFTSEEIDAALTAGFEEITLGRERLRTETAALAAVVMASVVNTLAK